MRTPVDLHKPSGDGPEAEWTLLEAVGRLARSGLYIAFFFVLHHGLEWLLRLLGDEKTWIGLVIIHGTGLAEVIAILGIVFIEAYLGIMLAAKGASRRLRR